MKQFLSSASDEEAEELWEYFDGTPYHDLIHELIKTVIDTHPVLFKPVDVNKKPV